MLPVAITEGSVQSVHLDQSARDRHLYVLGATGTGKSTLLANMICQDIREGRGVCLIDPHGDLYDQIVESLPLNRDLAQLMEIMLQSAGFQVVLAHSGAAGLMAIVIALERRRKTQTPKQMDPQRRGTFTSNLLAFVESHPGALYFTGWQPAGEHLGQVLPHRSANPAEVKLVRQAWLPWSDSKSGMASDTS